MTDSIVKLMETVREGREELKAYTENADVEAEILETSTDLTVESLTRKPRMNGWKETTVICPDGTEATISPCGYGDIHSLSDCEYFLLYWDMPWGGEDKIEKIVDKLNRHAELKAEDDKEKVKLRDYFEKGEADGWENYDWSWYSDWHKDLYGFRPHGHVCGVYVNPWRAGLYG